MTAEDLVPRTKHDFERLEALVSTSWDSSDSAITLADAASGLGNLPAPC